MRRIAPLCLLFVLALAAPAAAATVTSAYAPGLPGGDRYPGEPSTQTVAVVDRDGVANHVRVAATASRVEIADDAAPLIAGMGCAQADSRSVVCPVTAGALGSVGFVLGAGDDTLTFESRACWVGYGPVETGPGDDTIGPSDCPTTIDPGPGDDIVDAGGGDDTVTYRRSGSGVDLSLGRGVAVAADGRDVLRGFEEVVGSRFGDVLAGDDRPNVLLAGGGDDRLVGGPGDDELLADSYEPIGLGGFFPGDDVLAGGPGRDELEGARGTDVYDGGPGDDAIFSLDHAARIECGGGADRVRWSAFDVPLGGCETRSMDQIYEDVSLVSRPRDERWGIRIPLSCDYGGEPLPCRAVASVRDARTGGLLGRVRRTIPIDGTASLRLALSSSGRAVVRRRGRIVARVRLTWWTGPGYEAQSDAFAIVLRSKG